ncbi:hypothetical protein G6F68_014185 [Rhizopus microsporus]|nr:hypothetical protein G6F68_014185 [Rhizopus microsporus]
MRGCWRNRCVTASVSTGTAPMMVPMARRPPAPLAIASSSCLSLLMSAWIRRAKRTAHSPASLAQGLAGAGLGQADFVGRPQEGAAFLDGDKQPELFGMEARHDGIQAGREVCHEQKL